MKNTNPNRRKHLSRPAVRLLAGAGLLALAAGTAHAQIDPDARKLLQLGVDSSLHNQGPMGAYAFYYWNMPNELATNQVLRLAIAPVYVDGDYGFQHLLGKQTDLAVGAFGGLWANNYQEVDAGNWKKDQSFDGNGGGARVSLYHRVNPEQMIPLTLVLRESVNFVSFDKTSETAWNYTLPESQPIATTRVGFRWGGKEPVLTPKLAMEVSGWYELDHRCNSGNYGYNVTPGSAPGEPGPYNLESNTQRIFGRAAINYLTLESHQYLTLSIQGGVELNPDRLGCYRLGGMLPYTKEFPLNIPGYYFQELSAQSFGLVNLGYGMPLDKGMNWEWINTAAAGLVDYVDGTQNANGMANGNAQSGAFNSGVGTGLGYTATSRRWKVFSEFGYGFEAERSNGRGGYSLGLAFQYNFGAIQTDSDKAWEELEQAEGNAEGVTR